MTAVAIIVPGIMGCVLKLGDETIWPGPLGSLWLPYDKMQELMREDLVATDCIRTYSVTKQYQDLIDYLATCGFSETDRTLVVAAYDWRKDNALAAEVLATHIDAAVTNHGADAEISILGHSMGGLVSRYYLESGHFNTRPGFSRVRRLLTLGTPHNGAALALPMILGYQKQLFLSKDQVLQAASDPRYPAAYQLLPPSSEPFAWNGDVGKSLGDIYDRAVGQQLGLVAANLAAAQRFRAGLDFARRPADVRYFCFAGTRQTTATHVLLRPVSAGRLRPDAVEDEDGGDGTVPTWSAFLPALQRQFVGGKHSTIYQNAQLKQVLGIIFGRTVTLAAVPAHVEVAVRDTVVEPGDDVRVTITFPESIGSFSGVVTVERAHVDPATGQATGVYDPPSGTYPVTYTGLGMEDMSLVFASPDMPGPYRVAFRDTVTTPPAGYDELIVQQT